MDKIAIVLPFFPDVDNKKEVRETLKEFAGLDALLKKIDVNIELDIVTTTASEHLDKWKNQIVPGVRKCSGQSIYRFMIDESYETFLREGNKTSESKCSSKMQEYVYCCKYGPVSRELFDFIRNCYSAYSCVIFWGVQYYTTSVCIDGIDNAVVVLEDNKQTYQLIQRGYFKRVLKVARKLFVSKINDSIELVDPIVYPVEDICDVGEFPWFEYETNTNIVYQGLIDYKLQPAFEKNNVTVVLASDNNYVSFLSVAIQSVMEHASSQYNYDIIILSDKISLLSRKRIQNMCILDNVSIRFIEIGTLLDEYIFSFRCKQLSRATFSRMFLPELLDAYEKVAYLDCDILVQADLYELYNEDISGMLVAAVKDRYVATLRDGQTEEYDHIKNDVRLSDEDAYFNAGILLMNLESFRSQFSTAQMMKLAVSRTWMWEDQDVLNFLCKGKVKWLDQKWNMLWGMDMQVRDMIMSEMDYFNAFNMPAIIHYAGGCLPTKTLDDIYSCEFWQTAKNTPYYECLVRLSVMGETKRLLDGIHLSDQGVVVKNNWAKRVINKIGRVIKKFFISPIKAAIKYIIGKIVTFSVWDVRKNQEKYEINSCAALEKIENMMAEKM